MKALAQADVVLKSGGEADEWLDGALDAAGVDERRRASMSGAAAGIEGDDAHWWQDPLRAMQAATAIGRAIPGADAAPYVHASAMRSTAACGAASTRSRRRSAGW